MPLTSLNPNLLGTDSTGASKLSSAGGLVQLHATGLLAIANNTANNFAVANNGSVGIGTMSPSTKLHIIGNSGSGVVEGRVAGGGNGGDYGILSVATSTSVKGRLVADAGSGDFRLDTAGSAGGIMFMTGAAYANALYIANTGNMIVGSTETVDSAKLQLFGAKVLSSGIPQQQLNIADTSAIATGVGGAVAFSALYSGGSYTTMGSISGVRENGTSGNYAGALIFNTRTNGADNTERMRINSSGFVTTPFQPAFMQINLSGYNTVGFLKGTGSTYNFNRGSNYNSTNGRFTAPIAGTYVFTMGVLVESGTGRLEGNISVNGVSRTSFNGTGTTYDGPTATLIVDLNSGDYVTVVRQSGTAHSDGGHPSTYFGGYLLG